MTPGDFTPCLRCGRPVGEKNGLTFYQVTLERMVFDPQAVRNTLGLTMMLRSPALAEAFNPTPEIAKRLGDPEKFLLCDDCAMRACAIAALDEIARERRESVADDAATSNTTDAAECAPAPSDDPPPQEAA